MDSGGAVLTAAVQNAPRVRWGSVETIFEWGAPRHQLVLPSALRDIVLEKLHGAVTGGHLGEAKLVHRVQERYYWPGYSESVKVWCRTCVKCA